MAMPPAATLSRERRREVLIERFHGCKQGNQPALAKRFDHETITGVVHDRFISRQLEFDGNADNLITAISKNFTRL
jgi:hypothetical protein